MLDKDYEDKSLKDVLDASPAALAGVTDADAAALAQAFTSRRPVSSARTGPSLLRRPWWPWMTVPLCATIGHVVGSSHDREILDSGVGLTGVPGASQKGELQ